MAGISLSKEPAPRRGRENTEAAPAWGRLRSRLGHSRTCLSRRARPSGGGPPPGPGADTRRFHDRKSRRDQPACQWGREWLDSPRASVLLQPPGRCSSSQSGPHEVTMAQVVGFIGLGIMGRPMAKNLLKAGYPLVVHSRSQGPVDELVAAGAKRASSSREVAGQTEVLITMLPNSPDVEQVALGTDGIVEGARKGLLYLD